MTATLTRHTERTLLVALGLVRFAQYAPFVGVLWGGSPRYSLPAIVIEMYVVSVPWSAALFAVAFRRNRVASSWALSDVAFAATATLVVGPICLGDGAVAWANWTVGPIVGAACVAVLNLCACRVIPAIALLASAYVFGVRSSLADPAGFNSALGNALNVVVFALVVWLIGANLRRTESAAESAISNEFSARLEQERTRALRRTIAVGLVTGIAEDVPTSLGTALADVAQRQAGLGLDVRQQFHGLPRSMQLETVDAIASAAREALNNVAKHSETADAWLTATGESDGSVRVTVTDHGCGFRQTRSTAGFGIDDSIRRRMREEGGEARVHSWPGEGTEVETLWPT